MKEQQKPLTWAQKKITKIYLKKCKKQLKILQKQENKAKPQLIQMITTLQQDFTITEDQGENKGQEYTPQILQTKTTNQLIQTINQILELVTNEVKKT